MLTRPGSRLDATAQFLFDTAEADFRGGESDINAADRLIVTSGKMVLLDKLLRRLKDTGHRQDPRSGP